jgi:hypothetical protein
MQAGWQQTTSREHRYEARRYGAWTCTACGEPVVGDAVSHPVEGEVPAAGFFYPAHVPNPTYPDNLPTDVATDARDAHRCASIGAWRACAAMARRAIQGACFNKGAPDKKLVEQIDWLEEQRLITPQMKDVAHRIRLSGNAGAHPDVDGLKDVTEIDAQRLLEFLDDFVKYVYEIPGRLAAMEEPSEALSEDEPNEAVTDVSQPQARRVPFAE